MQRSHRAVLAVLCVVALALGAATLQSPVSSNGGFGGAGSGGFADNPRVDGSGGSTGNGTSNLGKLIDIRGLCIPFLLTPQFYVAAFAAAALVAAVGYRRGGGLLAFALVGALGPPVFLVWMLLTTCEEPSISTGTPANFSLFAGRNGSVFQGLAGGGGPGSGAPSLAPTLLLLVALLVLLVTVAFLRATDDDVDEPDEPASEEADEEALAAMAGAAATAADRIEQGDADTANEVYRAWREMTTHLDVPNPRTSTPAEFRDAARDAGMATDHVAALTDVFREVRYGGADATTDREAQAVAALRAIEDAYGEGGADE